MIFVNVFFFSRILVRCQSYSMDICLSVEVCKCINLMTIRMDKTLTLILRVTRALLFREPLPDFIQECFDVWDTNKALVLCNGNDHRRSVAFVFIFILCLLCMVDIAATVQCFLGL